MYCTDTTVGPTRFCGRPPFTVDVNGITYYPMEEIEEKNYSVGSRVKYQCNTTDNTDQSESGSAKSWNINVLCSKNGDWSYQFSNQIYIHYNLTRSFPKQNSLDSDNDDNSYWVYDYTNLP